MPDIESKGSLERAVLIGIEHGQFKEQGDWLEFVALVEAAGAEEVGRLVQVRTEPDPALFIGSGKAQELASLIEAVAATLVISIQELSPSQVRNLENITGIRVIDRTNLILDIFAQRASSKEGKLQVELAQLKYLLPRLGSGLREYSRLGGGIGTRGPGETKLEVDKRRIRRRISEIQHQLDEVAKHRQIQRQRREKNLIPSLALVGYTNAGKSTLFNRLTNAGVSAADRLFDTLDPISRRLELPNHREIVLLDTVGLVKNLPHLLVAAFRATLEETVRATVLLKVLDASASDFEGQYQAIHQVLSELGITEKNTIPVLNKVDRIGNDHDIQRIAKLWDAVPISAHTGQGIPELLARIEAKLTMDRQVYDLFLPFSEAKLLDIFHREQRIVEQHYTEQGIKLQVEMESELARRYARFIGSEDTDLC